MPIDGALFIESLPPRHHHWLTALSVFFSLGSVVSALVALALLVGAGASWRLLLLALAVLTAMAAAARLGRFRTLESPAFLMASGRQDEAELVLQAMAPEEGLPPEDVHMYREEASQHTHETGALFAAGQARTTFILWLLWTLQSLAFTLFNAFYPLYLERKRGHTASRTEAAVLRDVLAYAVSSVPGSLVGAALRLHYFGFGGHRKRGKSSLQV
ncbi:hypothetical protein MEQU1_000613 [Malassezia equina]|uniref:Major facilitator superfamily (MFS) profile domain-containing protein n=1 Tax=Malassezia equina TaxID=1381935 RepID=A0AAF0IYZ9_9BASI|nr:hypothetical protein MEQU1_000613 [Malassezia equina]